MNQPRMTHYEAPVLEQLEVVAEQGFSITGSPNDFTYDEGWEN